MVNNLPPLAGPVDASGEPGMWLREQLTALSRGHRGGREVVDWLAVVAILDALELRQGCVCACCDHSEGSDCGCECHSEGKCAFQPRAAAVPSSPAQADLVRALHTVAITITDALSGKDVDFRKALRLIHDMQREARDGSLTLLALPPSSPTWLSIGTAPKDKRVLLYVPDEEGTDYSAQIGYLNNDDPYGAFWMYDANSLRYSHAHPPTHWMPLPLAPSPSAGAAQKTTTETKS